MLLEEHLSAWLHDQGVTAQISFDSLPDAEPHLCAAVSITGGLGMTLEQGFDRPTFSVLSRGPNGKAARDLGLQIDAAILDADPSFELVPDGPYVADKGRFGGPPAFVTMDDRNRAIRSATYWLEIER